MRICYSKRNLGLAIALCLSAAASQAANLSVINSAEDVPGNNPGQSTLQGVVATQDSSNALTAMIGPNESWALQAPRDLTATEVVIHGQQMYNINGVAVPVDKGEFAGAFDKNSQKWTFAIGNVMQGLDSDLRSSAPVLSPEQAQAIVLAPFQSSARQDSEIISTKPTQLWVYQRADGRAVLAYKVEATARVANDVTAPTSMIDAITGQQYTFENRLQAVAAKGSGPGGNPRTGQYEHNQTSGLGIALDIDKVGTTCRLANPSTLVVDARGGTGTGSTAIAYTCADATNRFVEATVNGGFGRAADILAFGKATTDFYRNTFGQQPLKCSNLLVQYENVMVNYDNAFYQGCQMRYGNGSQFYPLTSTDVVAHEISHGVTEGRSALVYSNQSGGLNESYSDQAGIAFTTFLTGSPQGFQIGSQISKTGQPLRYMATPSRDGRSIDNVNQFTNGLDPHFGSGPPNRYFAMLSQSPGYDPVKALRISFRANDMLWTPNTTYVQMGNALCRAATDLQFDTAPVRQALVAIGLNPTGCNGGGTPTPPGGGNVLQNGVPLTGISLAANQQQIYSIVVPTGRSRITFTTAGTNGDTDLYVRYNAQPTTTTFNCKSEGPTSNESCGFATSVPAGTYFILLNGFAAATGVTLTATYQ